MHNVLIFTEEWNGFQFRSPTYIDGHIEPYKFDLVLWRIDERGNKYCFSVGFLEWNEKESFFTFRSVGIRYLEYRVDGLEKFILDFCADMEKSLTENGNSYWTLVTDSQIKMED